MSVERCETAIRHHACLERLAFLFWMGLAVIVGMIVGILLHAGSIQGRILAAVMIPVSTYSFGLTFVWFDQYLDSMVRRWDAARRAYANGSSNAPTLLNIAIGMDPFTPVFSFLRIYH
jgi:hypothetical protein